MGKWEIKKLSEVTEVIGGGTPKTTNPEYWGDDWVWLSPTDLPGIGEIADIKDSKKKITNLGLQKSSAKLLPKGTVLFSSRATIGKIGIASVELCTNQGFKNFVCKEELNNLFLAYTLKHFTEDITGLSNSTTFKEISTTAIKQFKIPLPPLPEQKRIVAKLDGLFEKIDQAIKLLEENIAHTEALMGSVLDEELSRFETKTAKIKDVLREINSGFACNKSNEIPKGYVHLRTHNIDTSGNLNFDLLVKINPIKVDKKKNQIKKGDILFNNTNSKELVGKTALVDQDYNYGYSNHLTRIRLKEDLILPEFFVNYMINLHSQGYFLQICKKWIGQAGVNTRMLKDISIKYPSV